MAISARSLTASYLLLTVLSLPINAIAQRFTSPSENDVWRVGDPKNISWVTNDRLTPTKLELHKLPQNETVWIKSLRNVSSYGWTVTDTCAGGDGCYFTLTARSSKNTTVSATSPTFTVEEQPTSTPTEAPESDAEGKGKSSSGKSGKSKKNNTAIIAGVVGGVAGLVLVGLATFWGQLNKKKKARSKQLEMLEMQQEASAFGEVDTPRASTSEPRGGVQQVEPHEPLLPTERV